MDYQSTRIKLEEELYNELQNLSTLDLGSEEYSIAVDGVTKLYKLKIENDQLDKKSIDEQKEQKAKLIFDTCKGGVDITKFLLQLGFCASWMTAAFKFEEEGTINSDTFRWLYKHFRLPM